MRMDEVEAREADKSAFGLIVAAGKKASDSDRSARSRRRIDNYIAEFDDWRGERLAELRKIIHEVNPAVVEGLEVDGYAGLVASRDVCSRQYLQSQGEAHFPPRGATPRS